MDNTINTSTTNVAPVSQANFAPVSQTTQPVAPNSTVSAPGQIDSKSYGIDIKDKVSLTERDDDFGETSERDKSSGFLSNLASSFGGKKIVNSEPEAAVKNEGKPKETGKSEKIDDEYYKYADKMGTTLKSDGTNAPMSENQREILAKGLSGFDKGAIKNLSDNGVKYVIAEPWYEANKDKNNGAPDGGYPMNDGNGERIKEWPKQKESNMPLSGGYDRTSNVVLLSSDDFSRDPKEADTSNMRHETGHALDDMRADDKIVTADQADKLPQGTARNKMPGEDNKYIVPERLSDSDNNLKQLYSDYKDRYNKYSELSKSDMNRISSPLWSLYALSTNNPSEYLAEAVKYYTSGEESADKLKTADNAMYNYVKNFLQVSSGSDFTNKEDPANNGNIFS